MSLLVFIYPRTKLYFNVIEIRLLQSICYELLLMCSKNYQIWLRRFKDKSKKCALTWLFWSTLYIHVFKLTSGIKPLSQVYDRSMKH